MQADMKFLDTRPSPTLCTQSVDENMYYLSHCIGGYSSCLLLVSPVFVAAFRPGKTKHRAGFSVTEPPKCRRTSAFDRSSYVLGQEQRV